MAVLHAVTQEKVENNNTGKGVLTTVMCRMAKWLSND